MKQARQIQINVDILGRNRIRRNILFFIVSSGILQEIWKIRKDDSYLYQHYQHNGLDPGDWNYNGENVKERKSSSEIGKTKK